jgi:potassium efflux system protein
MQPSLRSALVHLLAGSFLAIGLGLAAPAAASGPLGALRGSLPGSTDAEAKAIADAQEAAASADRETEALAASLAAMRAEAANAPARSQELTTELATDRRQSLDEWSARLPPDADVETLEAVLEQEQIAADQLRARINESTGRIAEGLAQPGRSGAQMAELQRRIDELALPVVAAENESPELTAARQLRNTAERRRLVAEQELRQGQLDLSSTQQRLQELELRVLRHRLLLREPRLELLQQRIADLGRQQLEALAAQLDERVASVPVQDHAAVTTAKENQALGQEMLLTNERIASQRRLIAEDERMLERDLAGLRDSRSRVELGGQSEEVGTWLWAEVRRLEPVPQLRSRLDQVRQSLAEQRLRLISLNELQRELEDIPGFVRELREQAPGREEDTVTGPEGSHDLLEDLLQERKVLIERMEPLLWRRVAALEQTERNLVSRIATNQELRQTLDRHLLWVRSHAPVSREWLAQVPAGLGDLVKPSRFATTARLMAKSVSERPFIHVASVLLVVALLLLAHRARSRLDRLALSIREVRKDRYTRTVESLGWTLVAASPLPVALWLLGLLLQDVGAAGKYSHSLGVALQMMLVPTFTLMFLRHLVRERGLAHARFRWTKPRRESLRKWLGRLSAVLLPVYFVVALAFVRDQELAISVHARLAMVLGSLVGAWALWDMLAAGRLWHARGVDNEPSRLRAALRVLLPLALVATAGLALGGYIFSSAMVYEALFTSVGMVTAVGVVHGMLSRWFVLGERRLALRRLEQRREAEAAAADEGSTPEDGGEAIAVELEEEITLEKVSAHSRSLLRALRLTLLVLGLVWVWADVLPALTRFDDIALWSVNDLNAAGENVQVPVTLLAVLLGLMALALTFVAARNLPGLIEIGLLSRVNIDAASRYAITSVSRYLIVLVGIVVGFGLLGLRWGQLQWMAAALTLGLGFGLQEIFANFVSGLILLFERPFRVGDVITVNNLDGTVTKIRTRATTILDFDNKEIVVPNKTFITGQLVNWTLSDEITRITIKVGVDYGTDPATVHRLLMQAADENPRVLKDRAPRSWLLEFGASTLEFELRVFVGAMADRLAVRDEINTHLIHLFEQNGIAFAYPQLDLHVRDVPDILGAARGDAGHGAPEAKVPRGRASKEPGEDAG